MGIWMVGGSIGFAASPVMVAVLPGSVLGRDEGERGLKGLEAEVPVGGHAEASTAQHKKSPDQHAKPIGGSGILRGEERLLSPAP